MPKEAYQFAKGVEVTLVGGQKVQMTRPLDFAAITDHAEFLGEWYNCVVPGQDGYNSLFCKAYRLADPEGDPKAYGLVVTELQNTYLGDPTPERPPFCKDVGCLDETKIVWDDLIVKAEEAYDPCTFTTFIGYEWTAKTQLIVGKPGPMRHRNVIFANEKVPPLPASYFEQPTPEALWTELDNTCRKSIPGCDLVAIPHNSNLSQGQIFTVENLSKQNAKLRNEIERIVEIYQHKGASECTMEINPQDELCDFEVAPDLGDTEPNSNRLSYVREALKEGLSYEKKEGVNPIKMGFIGGTDTHNSIAGFTNEVDYSGVGHHGLRSDEPSELLGSHEKSAPAYNPGGLAGVWAEENTRESIFSALKRREVFATSGTFVTVRFFGGWDFRANICSKPDFAEIGYSKGVPMGPPSVQPQGHPLQR